MSRVNIILGPPGTGKTTTLLNVVDEAISSGMPPEKIAYLAFTRKAAYEAQERAMARFNIDSDRLPYFRTLHSLAFKKLGIQIFKINSRKQSEILDFRFFSSSRVELKNPNSQFLN